VIFSAPCGVIRKEESKTKTVLEVFFVCLEKYQFLMMR